MLLEWKIRHYSSHDMHYSLFQALMNVLYIFLKINKNLRDVIKILFDITSQIKFISVKILLKLLQKIFELFGCH